MWRCGAHAELPYVVELLCKCSELWILGLFLVQVVEEGSVEVVPNASKGDAELVGAEGGG